MSEATIFLWEIDACFPIPQEMATPSAPAPVESPSSSAALMSSSTVSSPAEGGGGGQIHMYPPLPSTRYRTKKKGFRLISQSLGDLIRLSFSFLLTLIWCLKICNIWEFLPLRRVSHNSGDLHIVHHKSHHDLGGGNGGFAVGKEVTNDKKLQFILSFFGRLASVRVFPLMSLSSSSSKSSMVYLWIFAKKKQKCPFQIQKISPIFPQESQRQQQSSTPSLASTAVASSHLHHHHQRRSYDSGGSSPKSSQSGIGGSGSGADSRYSKKAIQDLWWGNGYN